MQIIVQSVSQDQNHFYHNQHDDFFRESFNNPNKCYINILANLFTECQFTKDSPINNNVVKGIIKTCDIFETDNQLISKIDIEKYIEIDEKVLKSKLDDV